SCTISGPAAADFAVAVCPNLVEPGNTLALNLSCTPSAAGARSATLTLVTNDSTRGTSFSYPLQCLGVDPNAVDLGVPVPSSNPYALLLLGLMLLTAAGLTLRPRV
ncbi:MAG TPA: hypothetical protein VN259_03315, partial [Xanthomonadales bacterium]|nr:hypothetical protein [Xanthomonadales bacterium]